jgi:hypothetical protein
MPRWVLLIALLGSCTKDAPADTDPAGDADTDTDADSDTDTDADTDTDVVDADEDGVPAGVDCDDADKDVGAPSSWYDDADADGWGAGAGTSACEGPAGAVTQSGDCDDANPAFHPNAAETCEEAVDYNCDGSVGTVDADADGVAACDDCNDADASVTLGDRWYPDADGDGHGVDGERVQACEPPPGYSASKRDCDDTNAAVSPDAEEACNGFDDDCDERVDDDDNHLANGWHPDGDGDGFGAEGRGTCTTDTWWSWVEDATDCDDQDPAVNTAADEICENDRDDDCDGQLDEADCQ